MLILLGQEYFLICFHLYNYLKQEYNVKDASIIDPERCMTTSGFFWKNEYLDSWLSPGCSWK